MNSLTYLSRQFDVLASPRTPPSTPSEERNSFLNDGGVRALQQDGTSDTSLKRIKTWSTKSFLFPPAQRQTGPSTPKRSHSSPADIITMAALATQSTTANSSEVTVRSKGADSLLKRVFFVRVFVVLWNALRSGWASLARRNAARTEETTVEEGTDTDEKETEDESQGEKFVSLVSSTPHQPPISPFPSPPSANVPSIIYSLHRSDTGPAFPSESQPGIGSSQSQQLLSPSSSQSTVLSGSASRSETPPFPTRKTPFHLPKTLVLDLDETLIHSTSRPLFASGSGGSGLLGLGGFGKRNKGAGHVVEVVLGGRSTLYHVYKRPFVDYFLRKVCWFATAQVISLINDTLGLGMVHTGHFYCIYARVRRPCNRLA
jgi:CTD nuclear envelope phosphatase 1